MSWRACRSNLGGRGEAQAQLARNLVHVGSRIWSLLRLFSILNAEAPRRVCGYGLFPGEEIAATCCVMVRLAACRRRSGWRQRLHDPDVVDAAMLVGSDRPPAAGMACFMTSGRRCMDFDRRSPFFAEFADQVARRRVWAAAEFWGGGRGTSSDGRFGCASGMIIANAMPMAPGRAKRPAGGEQYGRPEGGAQVSEWSGGVARIIHTTKTAREAAGYVPCACC